jgi:hypothetical protein
MAAPDIHASRTLVPLSQREEDAWLWQSEATSLRRLRRIDPGVVRHDRGPRELEATSEQPRAPRARDRAGFGPAP